MIKMINWSLGLDSLNDRIQRQYLNSVKIFLIKEDLNYLEIFLNESDYLSGTLEEVDQFFFGSKLFIWYQTKLFSYQLEQLIDELKRNRTLLKRCLLIECEIETLASNWSSVLKSLSANRIKLYRDLGDFFRELRRNCNLINDNYKEYNERLFNDNQISKLPIDTFDSILDAEDFNYVKLKSLVQLVKLEMSELLILIIFYYSVDRSHLYNNLKSLTSTLQNLLAQMKKFNSLLGEDCSLFTQFFMKTKLDKSSNSKINPKHNEILLNLKSAKTNICSSLLMIDNCLTKILEDENSDQIDQLDNEKMIDELTSAIDALRLIPTGSKTKTQFVHKEVQKLNSNRSVDLAVKEVNLSEEIPDFEVFEAYIEENDDKIDKIIEKYEDYLFEVKPKLPKNLYGELKEVLDVKAKDYRVREAKALGIDEEELVKQRQESTTIEKRTKPKYSDDLFINPLQQAPINLFKLASNSNKKMNFLSNEENFGDELSSNESND